VAGSFRLTRDAERDVQEIYLYTLERFGLAQAEAYASGLLARFAALATGPSLGRDFGDIHPGARRVNQKSHAVYYRIDADGILILRVLHQSMDPARHLGRS
jgi:toxin ParE1/3/4